MSNEKSVRLSDRWNLVTSSLVLGLTAIAGLLIIQNQVHEQRHARLRERAQRIFSLEKQQVLQGSARDRTALSVALAFRDYPGMEKILQRIEN